MTSGERSGRISREDIRTTRSTEAGRQNLFEEVIRQIHTEEMEITFEKVEDETDPKKEGDD